MTEPTRDAARAEPSSTNDQSQPPEKFHESATSSLSQEDEELRSAGDHDPASRSVLYLICVIRSLVVLPPCDCATIQTSAAGVITHERNIPSACSRVLSVREQKHRVTTVRTI